jgi:hypothetical protein
MAMITTFVIGLLILIAGLAMVLAAAFRRRLSWGLAMILLPVIYPLYALFNWSQPRVRNGFLMSVAGALIVLAAAYGGVAKDLPFNQAQDLADKVPTALPPDDPLPNAAAADAIVLPAGHGFDPLADERFVPPAPPLSPRSDKRVASAGPAHRFAYHALSREDVARYLGKTIKIVTREGKVEQGVLVGSDAKSLLLETLLPGGSAAFQYRFHEVKSMYVYDRRPPAAKLQRRGSGATQAGAGAISTTGIEAQGGVRTGGVRRSLGSSSGNQLELEGDLPHAVVDLPVWGVQDKEDNSWRVQDREIEPESRLPPVEATKN